jgi:hypothetical protein
MNKFCGIGTVWAAVIGVLIFAGCSMTNTLPIAESAPEEDPAPPVVDTPAETPPIPKDDPDKNIMSLDTGNKIFDLADDEANKGWMIKGFKSALELAAYLARGAQEPVNRAVAAAIVEGRFEFTIPTIGGKLVTRIGEGAFTPGKNGNDDISNIIYTIHIPETVVEMAKIELGGTAEPITIDIPQAVLDKITEKENIKEEEVVTGDKVTVTKPSTGGGGGSTTIVEGPPVLKTTAVSYNQTTAEPTVTFTFEKAVTAVTKVSIGWAVTGTNTAVITAVYKGTGYGSNQAISFTAASSSGKTVDIPSVTALSVRSFPTTDTAVYYTIKHYHPTLHTAIVQKEGQTALDGFLVTDAAWQKLFNAIYIPNAPDTVDTVETGKTAVPYNADISAAALNLFKVKIGKDATSTNRVEIKGTDLPAADGADADNLIVIDIGAPGGADNDNLNFTIPKQGLGVVSEDYGHIRLRVNKGADLLIEADNSGYKADGAGSPCPAGYFNYGCAEVMAGGKLRDGAYEGFPLGNHAVILNRSGSYLGVGPEKDSGDATGNMAGTYDKYYSGWLVGPSSANPVDAPKIEWAGNGYLEVRPTELIISTNMTVKKSVGLIYNVWIYGAQTVTIDAGNEGGGFMFGNPAAAVHGLFANFDPTHPATTDYKIYGSPEAKIVVNPGSTIHKGFLTSELADYGEVISVTTGAAAKTIPNTKTGALEKYADAINGYLGWKVDE